MENNSKINSMDIAILATILLSVTFIFIRELILKPSEDGTEFAQAAWLIAHGKILYRDFFQNHSPWYLFLIYSVFDTNSNFFLLKLSLLHWFAALFGAFIFSRIIWLEAASDDPPIRRRSAFIAFLLFLTFYRAFVDEVVRPETLSVAALVIAGLCGKRMQGAGRVSRWILAIGFALSLGLSVCFTPRATILAAAVVVWIAWENRGPGSWVRMAVAMAGSAAFLLAIVAPFVSFPDVYRWVIVFNGQMPILHPLGRYTLAIPSRYFAPAFAMTTIIVTTRATLLIFGRKLNKFQNSFIMLQDINEDSRLKSIEICLFLSWIFLYADRRWVLYSFDFIALMGISWLSIVGIHASRRLSQGPRVTRMVTATGFLALALLWNTPNSLLGGVLHHRQSTPELQVLNGINLLHLGGYLRTLADVGRPEPEPISIDMLEPTLEARVSLAGWLRWSKRVCAVADGQTALFFSARPVCLQDPSYYWVRWPGLPTSDWAADIRKARPVIVEKICPHIHCGTIDPIESPDDGYVDAGWAWIRRDLAQRLAPAPGK